MQKKKINIDLGNMNLSDVEYKALLDAVFETVNEKLTSPKKKKSTKQTLTRGTTRGGTRSPQPVDSFKAEISVEVRDTEPGLSHLVAIHNNIEEVLTSSGKMKFDNVQHGDIISVKGKSLGKTEFVIDVDAEPPTKKFQPGTINFLFFIL